MLTSDDRLSDVLDELNPEDADRFFVEAADFLERQRATTPELRDVRNDLMRQALMRHLDGDATAPAWLAWNGQQADLAEFHRLVATI